MDVINQFGESFSKKWNHFIKDEQLNQRQAEQLINYMILLRKENETINLTSITDPIDIISYHFQDSLKVAKFINFNNIKKIADIGTGGGFPGIPLKIMFPDISMVLIEVNQKKVQFLEMVIQELGLKNCEVVRLDWRNFLRKTEYEIDLFCARASLKPEELIRIFKSGCSYKNAQIAYWASRFWKLGIQIEPFFKKELWYNVGDKQRKLILFSNV